MVFKKALILIALISVLSFAYASVHIVSPIDRTVADNGYLETGAISNAETLEIIVDKDSQKGFEWSAISADTSAFGNGASETEQADETLILKIKIPKNAEEKQYSFPVTVSNSQNQASESFTVLVDVKKQLWSASLMDVTTEATVGDEIEYRILLINDSIAPHTININPNLPTYWTHARQVTLQPKKTHEVVLKVTPATQGKRLVVFNINSALNGYSKNLSFALDVKPTLFSKYEAVQFGLPFFSISLLPYYLIDALLALVS